DGGRATDEPSIRREPGGGERRSAGEPRPPAPALPPRGGGGAIDREFGDVRVIHPPVCPLGARRGERARRSIIGPVKSGSKKPLQVQHCADSRRLESKPRQSSPRRPCVSNISPCCRSSCRSRPAGRAGTTRAARAMAVQVAACRRPK